jgi:hypothetical protein
MIKSQNRKLNLLIIFLVWFVSYSIPALSDPAKDRLVIADSLFVQKKYTQSFDLYDEIYQSYNKVSPSMLLKMAFVKEGLGDYTNALYYLNLYYLKTYDKKVLKKMEALAEKHKLSGYNYDDVAFFLNIYYQYQLQIDLFSISLILLFFAVFIYRKRKYKIVPRVYGYYYLAFLAILLLLNNFGREQKKAIITADRVYLMDGPSSGSNVVDIVKNGHKVSVLGKKDIWTRIEWGDKKVYIKEFNLKPIEL